MFLSASNLFHSKRVPTDPSVAFVQVNVQKYPEMGWPGIEDHDLPLFMVMIAGHQKVINFQLDPKESKKDRAQRFADDIQAMTGTYFQELNCDQLEMLVQESIVSFVYFGSEKEIQQGGKFDYVHKLSTYDRFTYPEQPILFFYNTDRDCMMKRQLDPGQANFVLYVDRNAQAFILREGQDDVTFARLYDWISVSITQVKLKYNRRAASILHDLKFNALAYIAPTPTDDDL